MASGNRHDNFGEDRACRSGNMLADRQTHRQTIACQNNISFHIVLASMVECYI